MKITCKGCRYSSIAHFTEGKPILCRYEDKPRITMRDYTCCHARPKPKKGDRIRNDEV